MTYSLPWRKAITVSVCLHIFLLATVGYLAAGLTAPVPADEKIILEMDLINEPLEQPGISPDLAQAPLPESNPSVTKPIQNQPLPSAIPAMAPAPTVTTSDLSMTEAEIPAPSISSASAATSPSSDKPSGGNSRSRIVAPSILVKVDPVYPTIARQTGLQGTVLLKIEILANGRPGRITLASSTAYPALDEAAVAAVRQWKFVPAKDLSSGRAIVCTTTLPISFLLNNNK
ncbi:MAG: TonB family protein [Sporomusa sp.]|nr:TonB family protein [Sporomusa sp.]